MAADPKFPATAVPAACLLASEVPANAAADSPKGSMPMKALQLRGAALGFAICITAHWHLLLGCKGQGYGETADDEANRAKDHPSNGGPAPLLRRWMLQAMSSEMNKETGLYPRVLTYS
jgi:hypothetical protein